MSEITQRLKKMIYMKTTVARAFEKESTKMVDVAKTEYRQDIRICLERARLLTGSYKATEGEPMILRRAKAFAHILEKMTI